MRDYTYIHIFYRFQELDTSINNSTQDFRSINENWWFSTISNDLRQLPKTAWLYYLGNNAGKVADSCARRSTLVPPLLETDKRSACHFCSFITLSLVLLLHYSDRENYPKLYLWSMWNYARFQQTSKSSDNGFILYMNSLVKVFSFLVSHKIPLK